MAIVRRIAPCLWFDDQAEEAANFYASIFKDSKIEEVTRYGTAATRPEGMAMTVSFKLRGQGFVALNGGPEFKFNEAISLLVSCDSQEEVDYFWDNLGEGGEAGPCGWLKDKFGLSWQIIPTALPELLSDPDPEKSQRVMAAMLQMSKIDIDGLKQAYKQ